MDLHYSFNEELVLGKIPFGIRVRVMLQLESSPFFKIPCSLLQVLALGIWYHGSDAVVSLLRVEFSFLPVLIFQFYIL